MPMSKNNEHKKLVPELRFGEFQEEWQKKKLIGITDKKIKWSFTGGPFGSSLKSSDYVPEENGIRIIQLQNIGDGEFKNDYKIFTSKEKADELLSNNIYPGEIIMSKMGDPVGRACLIPNLHDRYVMASDGIRVVVDEKNYDKYFIYSLINSKYFRTKIENSSTGSTRKRIGLSVLKNLNFYVPKSREEQQKIAATLTSLDNLIAAENEKLEGLQAHKKGLLQQLFPAKGETVPRLRFGEFSGEWEDRKLGKVGEFVGGGTPTTSKPEYWNGDIQWYTPTEVKNGILNPSIRTITKNGLKNSSAKLLPQGTILITTRATIGDAAIANYECSTNQGFQSLIVKDTESNLFWYYWIIKHKNELTRRSSGSYPCGQLHPCKIMRH